MTLLAGATVGRHTILAIVSDHPRATSSHCAAACCYFVAR